MRNFENQIDNVRAAFIDILRELDIVYEKGIYDFPLVKNALTQLSKVDRRKVQAGLELYAKAFKHSRIHSECFIRSIEVSDNAQVKHIIRQVLNEHGADRPGFAFVDPELEDMHKTYCQKNWCYLVIERKSDRKILGGAGIGSLQGGESSVCELKKMYLLPETRGLKLGYALLQQLLSYAKECGYQQCYLETFDGMKKANAFYINTGFQLLDKPLGNTGHFACDKWYLKTL